MSKFNLSVSLLKAFEEFKYGEGCGYYWRRRYIDKDIPQVETEAQLAGKCFEYWATGALDRDGKAPEPIKLKSGGLPVKFQSAQTQAKIFQEVAKELEMVILATGIEYVKPFAGATVKGVFDAIVEFKNPDKIIKAFGCKLFSERAILDLKFSGFIRNKWEKYGWDDLKTKDGLLQQPVCYTWLHKQLYGEKLPFIFYVASSTNDYDRRLFQVDISDTKLAKFEVDIENAQPLIENEILTGCAARPSPNNCENCPLKLKGCEYYQYCPPVEYLKY